MKVKVVNSTKTFQRAPSPFFNFRYQKKNWVEDLVLTKNLKVLDISFLEMFKVQQLHNSSKSANHSIIQNL